MKHFFNFLLTPDSPDTLTRLLTAWRLWLVSALGGALIAAALYALAPPPFQARATVLVDQNIEEAWVYYPDRQLFFYLERETRKLEEIAWADDTLQVVAQDQEGLSISQLRDTVLFLEQPREGGWHFWAEDTDAMRAAELASTWAKVFVDQVQNNLAVSAELEKARQALEDYLLANPEPNVREVQALTSQLGEALEAVPGISPYVQLQVTQDAEPPTARTIAQATFLLVGSVTGVVGMAFLVLFFSSSRFQTKREV